MEDMTSAEEATAYNSDQSMTMMNMMMLSEDKKQKPKLTKQENLKCPLCDSHDTKFCYFVNHSLSQPRYFCKNCRRYWTRGGALREIPVGDGGSRKKPKLIGSGSKLEEEEEEEESVKVNPGEELEG